MWYTVDRMVLHHCWCLSWISLVIQSIKVMHSWLLYFSLTMLKWKLNIHAKCRLIACELTVLEILWAKIMDIVAYIASFCENVFTISKIFGKNLYKRKRWAIKHAMLLSPFYQQEIFTLIFIYSFASLLPHSAQDWPLHFIFWSNH